MCTKKREGPRPGFEKLHKSHQQSRSSHPRPSPSFTPPLSHIGSLSNQQHHYQKDKTHLTEGTAVIQNSPQKIRDPRSPAQLCVHARLTFSIVPIQLTTHHRCRYHLYLGSNATRIASNHLPPLRISILAPRDPSEKPPTRDLDKGNKHVAADLKRRPHLPRFYHLLARSLFPLPSLFQRFTVQRISTLSSLVFF